MKLLIERIDDDKKQTIGRLFVLNEKNITLYSCSTLELPWKHNQRRISCIPPGVYKTRKHRSRKFGDSFWLLNVPQRSEILIHVGNYYKDTLGCILPGTDLSDINRDGLMDVIHSRVALKKLLDIMPTTFDTQIILGPYIKKYVERPLL